MKIFVVAVVACALCSCNTIEGFGRDLAAGGQAITGAAADARTPAAPTPVNRAEQYPERYQRPEYSPAQPSPYIY